METFTITFGDRAENHVGMQKLGVLADHGHTLDDLLCVKKFFTEAGNHVEMVCLNDFLDEEIATQTEKAYILIIRNAVNSVLNEMDKKHEDLFNEMKSFEWDRQAKMYGRVVNKKARYNVCFGNQAQEANIQNGMGTVISWNQVPLLHKIKETLEASLKETTPLEGEGNYYYDHTKCGIGYHGDTERKKVVAIRVGASLPIFYQWFKDGKPVGQRIEKIVHGGDAYIMSSKAVGNDWKKKKNYTLRHAVGCDAFSIYKEKKKK